MTATENSAVAREYIELKRRLFDKYYSFLNDEQRKAVYTVNGPLLILAGAGSGKTTVLVNRLSFLIKYGNAYYSEYVPEGINSRMIEFMKQAESLPREDLARFLLSFKEHTPAPWKVMAITFTNKAAGEIKERVKKAFGEDDPTGNDIWTGTFHSICMRFLRRWSELLGYAPEFGICDNLLFVSKYEDEWESEVEKTDDPNKFYVFSYVVNHTCEWCSEYGTIGVKKVFGGLLRWC